MPKGANQKLKMLYLLEILRRETDEEHPLSLKQIIDLLEGVTFEEPRKIGRRVYDDKKFYTSIVEKFNSAGKQHLCFFESEIKPI